MRIPDTNRCIREWSGEYLGLSFVSIRVDPWLRARLKAAQLSQRASCITAKPKPGLLRKAALI